MNKILTICKRIVRKPLIVDFLTTANEGLLRKPVGNKCRIVGSSKLDSLKMNKKIYDNKRPFRVSIEGNIGAGKSSVINYLATFPGVEVYDEPIDWWRNVEGHNLLELLYKDINKWYSVFQQYVQLTRVQVQTTKPKNVSTTVQIFERSVQNNRFCFVEQAYLAGYLQSADYEVLHQWYQWIESNLDIKIDFIVYLRTSPELVFERMKNRGRKEEETVSLQYLKELHDSHEKWLLGNNKVINTDRLLVINANKPLADVFEECNLNKSRICRKVSI